MKEANAEAKNCKKFKFSIKSFDPYDPHCLCRDHYARVYYSWIHGACHWPEEDPWRYCYKSSRINEPFNMAVEWLATFKATTPQEATTTTAARNKPVQFKGKRKIVESIGMEQSYKFKEDPLVERVASEIGAKRGQHDRRIQQRKREKKILEEEELKLLEL